MKVKMTVDGVNEAIRRLKKIARGINKSDDILKDAGELGFKYAQTLAPKDTGALKMAMLSFRETPVSWVIISAPAQSDYGFPVNIPFETGEFGNMTMWGPGKIRIPFRPKRQSSIGFMKQTADFLNKEFAHKFGLRIERILKG